MKPLWHQTYKFNKKKKKKKKIIKENNYPSSSKIKYYLYT
jgi:hypothetical protein